MTTSAQWLSELRDAQEQLDRLVAYVATNLHLDPLAALCTPRPAGDTDKDRDLKHLWCEDHERPVARCRQDGMLCDGADIAQWAKRDGTGEAAVADADASRILWRYTRSMARTVMVLSDYVVTHQPPPPIPKAKRDAIARANELTCESCARATRADGPVRSEPLGGPTDLDGLLATRRLLCGACKARAKWRGERGLPPYPTATEITERWLRWNGNGWPHVHEPTKETTP